MVSVRQKLLRKGRTYESHFDIELRDGAKAVECEPRVVGEVQVFLEQPLAEDAERRLPVAAAARELREAEEVQRGDRVVVCAEAVGGLVRLEAEEGLVFEVRRMRRLRRIRGLEALRDAHLLEVQVCEGADGEGHRTVRILDDGLVQAVGQFIP